MHDLPFDKPGEFYRGNLHTHSTESDGRLSPEAVCCAYREAGYHFISLTDHFLPSYDFPLTDTRPFRTDNFTTLLGAELHTGQTELGHLWHILANGLPLDFARPPEGETGPEIAARALAAGAFVSVAHPAWYGLTEGDVLSLGEGVHAIEVFNGTSLDHNDRPDSLYMLDLMAMRGYRYHALATDDAHFLDDRHDAMIGWVWVKAPELTPDALLAALKAGHFYASTGPQIHDIQVNGRKTIYIRCSPAQAIFVTGRGWDAAHLIGHGVMEAELSLERFMAPYCRVTVRDRWGGRAWSNPIFFE